MKQINLCIEASKKTMDIMVKFVYKLYIYINKKTKKKGKEKKSIFAFHSDTDWLGKSI